MILFLGVATNKLMRSDLPPGDLAQPYLLEVAAELVTAEGKTVDQIRRRGRLPSDAAVQVGAQEVHGISTRRGRREGGAQKWLAYGLMELMPETHAVVSFGGMTSAVIESVMHRVAGADLNKWLTAWRRPGVERVDLQQITTPICKLPFDPPREDGGFRWPKREEAAQIIVGRTDFTRDDEEPSAALSNLRIEKAIYFALRDKGQIEVTA